MYKKQIVFMIVLHVELAIWFLSEFGVCIGFKLIYGMIYGNLHLVLG